MLIEPFKDHLMVLACFPKHSMEMSLNTKRMFCPARVLRHMSICGGFRHRIGNKRTEKARKFCH